MSDIADRIDAGARTIGEAIGYDPIKIAAAPRLPEPAGWPGEGIFFDMPDATYHSIFACSASVIKDMSVSPMYAWARSPLNPDREDDDTFAKELGRAYHTRICEGRAAYEARYAIALDKKDYPGALETADAIKAAIIDAGVDPISRVETGQMKPAPTLKESDRMKAVTRAATKADWIAQLLTFNPDAQIWDALVDAHADSIGTRTLVRAQDDKRIQVAARMIEGDPELAKAFSGGFGEVSLFWWDHATGAPCKARLDYLRLDGFSDLKTFSLKSEMPVERAIIREIASRRHFIPVCHYSDGIAAVKALVKADPAAIHCPDEWHDDTRAIAAQWAKRWAANDEEPQALYCFQATGIAPITRGKIMPRERMGTFGVTQRRVEELRRAFAANVEVFGNEPWLDQAPVETIEDTDIPMWATEI